MSRIGCAILPDDQVTTNATDLTVHAEKDRNPDPRRRRARRNIPTAELEAVMRDEDRTPMQVAYARRCGRSR